MIDKPMSDNLADAISANVRSMGLFLEIANSTKLLTVKTSEGKFRKRPYVVGTEIRWVGVRSGRKEKVIHLFKDPEGENVEITSTDAPVIFGHRRGKELNNAFMALYENMSAGGPVERVKSKPKSEDLSFDQYELGGMFA